MNDGDENLFFDKAADEKDAPEPKLAGKKTSLLTLTLSLIVLFVLAVGLGVLVGPALTVSPRAAAPSQPSADVTALQNRLNQMEKKLAEQPSPAPTSNGADLETLKAGLSGLAATLGKMQEQLTAASQKTDQVVPLAATALASALAYIQMHEAAYAGRPFEIERQALRTAMGNDAEGQSLLTGMEALAATGAPSLDLLQRQFEHLAPDAQIAIRRAAAKTWQEKIAVAFESLVSIRKISGQEIEPLSIASIALDLSRDKLKEALGKVEAYPPEARILLKDWEGQVQKRIELETAFAALGQHLIGKTVPQPPEQKQGEVP